ncbi:MAG: aminoglycoside phosphotransferase family protein [Chloroflexota bacterium]
MAEQILSGGNLNNVVRIDSTVRRTMQPWSATIHHLYQHLDAQGFSGCPKFLGIDEQGREILSYLEGEVGFVPYRWREDGLVQVAELLRAYHDATIDYVPPVDAHWQYVYLDPARHEVICHNDFAPYNMIFRNQLPYAVIDFDLAGPGPRLRDLAMVAYWFTPLSFHANDMVDFTVGDVQRNSYRLKLLCRVYGLPADDALLDMVGDVLTMLWRYPVQQVAAGRTEYQKLIDEGHTTHWRHEWVAFCQHREKIAQNL